MSRLRKLAWAASADFWLAQLMRLLPVAWASRLGGFFGARYGRAGIAARKPWVARMHANLQRFCGIADVAERERRIVEFARRFGRVYAEIPILQRLVRSGRLEIVGEENLRNLQRPVILASCHLGNWELMGRFVQVVPGRWCSLYLPLDSDVHTRLAVAARQRWKTEGRVEGELIAASPSSLRQISREVAKGSNFLFFIDEEKGGYVWAPSLGRQLPYAGNRWFAARLAVRHNLDIVPAYIVPTGVARYRAVIEPRLAVAEEGDDEARARALADALDQRMDRWIRESPEHWYWLSEFDLERAAPEYSSAK